MSFTRREKFNYFNNLVCIPKGLENHYTTIDLQNESCVTGKIKEVDGYMNINMENVFFYDCRGIEHYFENFFVRARLIRYVHIPKDQRAEDIIKNQMGSLTTRRTEKLRDNLKIKRAKQKHQETLQNIAFDLNK